MEIEIEYNKKKEKIVFKEEITFGEDRDILREANLSTIDEEGKVIPKIDQILIGDLRLVAYIIEAPFKIDLETIRSLPNRIGQELVKVLDKILEEDNITKEDIKKS